jgi:hypothetical protein
MYDKHGFILRVETTTNDVTFFRTHRMVEQRDGKRVMKLAYLKKSIYSLSPDLQSISRAANHRYIDSSQPSTILFQVSRRSRRSPTRSKNASIATAASISSTRIRRSLRCSVAASSSSTVRNRSLREHLGGFRSSQVSRLLKRLRLHGIIKKIGHAYKYYLTEFGRYVAIAGLTLKNLFLVPEFATPLTY